MLTIRRRLEDERGVSIVLFALLLVVLLGISGLVVDLGLVRADRQRNKSAADVAVAAGLQALNYNGAVAPFRGACAAIEYLRANHSELSTLTSSSGTWTNGSSPPTAVSGGDPCQAGPPASTAYTNYYTDPCIPGGSAREYYAWFSATVGSVDVKVQAGYDPTDFSGFSDEVGHTDYGDPDQDGCDNLAVVITEREQAGFGKVLGGGQMASTIRSVGRVDIGMTSEQAIGLLLLERNDCAAADIGSSTSQAVVLGSGTQPGLVHADSVGDGSDCSAKSVLNGQYTTPGIKAGRSPDGTLPGEVTTTGLLGSTTQQNLAISGWTPSSASAPTQVVPENTSPASATAPRPFGRTQVGRIAVDNKYRAAVAGLRSQAVNYFALSSAPAGWRTVDCTPDTGDLDDTTSPGIWVDCTSFGPAGNNTFKNKNFVFTGNIKLTGSDRLLQFPNAEAIFVKGTAGGGGSGVEISSGGIGGLAVNTGNSLDCDARRLIAPEHETTFVIGSNGLNVSSAVKMCQTFVFLMDGDRIYNAGEAPSNNSFNGRVNVNGNGGLEWTAPNRYDLRPTAAELALEPYEDLALWTETSAHGGTSHLITGGGLMHLKGVFFAPNANSFRLSGGGDGNIAANAQFIVRKLVVTGGAKLTLTADPENSVLTPTVSNFRLVR
jgi:hypothetical protein